MGDNKYKLSPSPSFVAKMHPLFYLEVEGLQELVEMLLPSFPLPPLPASAAEAALPGPFCILRTSHTEGTLAPSPAWHSFASLRVFVGRLPRPGILGLLCSRQQKGSFVPLGNVQFAEPTLARSGAQLGRK